MNVLTIQKINMGFPYYKRGYAIVEIQIQRCQERGIRKL